MYCIITRKKLIAVFCCLLTCILLVCGASWFRSVGATADAELGIRLPVIMYHSILKDASRTGKYVITPARIEEDLIYLRDNGYETVVVADLIAYVHDGVPLPEKPVMITLDDGYLNNLTYMLPLLEQYDMRAVISVIGLYSELYSETSDPNPSYAHLTWDDIQTLSESGRVEIQNHSYNMHRQETRRGASRRSGEGMEVYAKALSDDVMTLQQLLEENCGIVPTAFVYPFGQISDGSDDILRSLGFQCTMSCEERVNSVTRDAQSLFSLGRFNRAGTLSTVQFMKKIS